MPLQPGETDAPMPGFDRGTRQVVVVAPPGSQRREHEVAGPVAPTHLSSGVISRCVTETWQLMASYIIGMMPRHGAGLLSVLLVFTLSDRAGAKPVQEESFVRIGGIEQWITIKGSDSKNPVILFLHGGPGEALSPYADAMFAGWEKDFILVQWDQRGAGRTYGKTAPSIAPTLTLDRMTEDGIEVSEYLIRHLGKRRIVLVGSSWGSMLGIYMAHARPDLFYAYVGSAQIVNWPKNMSASYAHLLQMAEAAKDEKSIATLKQIGPFPWGALLPQWGLFLQVKSLYQAKVTTATDAPSGISPAYASAAEREQYNEADQTSFFQFWAGRQPRTKADVTALPLSGPLMHVDLPALGTKFEIPIFIVQGAEDLHALPDMAKDYFDSMQAPQKEFYLVPGTGHEPSAIALDRIRAILLERITPLAMSPAMGS